MTFDQCYDLTIIAAEQEVSLPVARHSTVLHFGRPLADRDRIGDLTMKPLFSACDGVTDASHACVASLYQLFLQGPTGLDEERAIDGLV